MITITSNQPIPRYEIRRHDDAKMCAVTFSENERCEHPPDGEPVYIADAYCVTMAYTDKLLSDIRSRFSTWLDFAKGNDL